MAQHRAWNKLAEICGEYLTKGNWFISKDQSAAAMADQSGNKRTAYDIIANQMQMLGSKSDSDRMPGGSSDRPAPAERPAPPVPPTAERFHPPSPKSADEDIPLARADFTIAPYGVLLFTQDPATWKGSSLADERCHRM